MSTELHPFLAPAATVAVEQVAETVLNPGAPSLSPAMQAFIDLLNGLRQGLDAVHGSQQRRPGDPEAVPGSLTDGFHWLFDFVYFPLQQHGALLAQYQATQQQLTAALAVVSQDVATLTPTAQLALANATLSLSNDAALRQQQQAAEARLSLVEAAVQANGLQDTALALRVTAAEFQQQALAAQQLREQTRLDLVAAQAADTKNKSEATAATLAQVQARLTTDEAALTTAQQAATTAGQRADAAQARADAAWSKADAAAGAAQVADAKAAAATAQAAALALRVTATETAIAALQARATNDEALLAAAQAKADAAKLAADAADAKAVALAARFKKQSAATPATTLSVTTPTLVRVTLPTPYADADYALSLEKQGTALLGVDMGYANKTAAGFDIELKNLGSVALAISASTVDVFTMHS